MLTAYGIKNCDTMKKAFVWFDDHNIAYDFHDYKKHGVDQAFLEQVLTSHGWETILNRRGTTWRQLPDAIKQAMDNKSALQTAIDNPSIIKRPLIANNDEILIGFDETIYKEKLL